jgi:signal transduction histidine kinase
MSTADELRAARARLIKAADDERRSLERALHDGLQQDLIALSVRLQLGRRLAAAGLPAAFELLDEIAGDVRDALERARRLADELYPSLLDVRGLRDALRQAVAGAGANATVEVVGLGRHPAEVELAAYFICRAALEGAVAGTGDQVAIRIEEREQAIRLTIECDAADLVTAAHRLDLARERVQALEGDLSVDPAAGRRARLVATIPLPRGSQCGLSQPCA